MKPSRRSLLQGGAATLLYSGPIYGDKVMAAGSGAAGAVDLALTALTPGLLRISLAPVFNATQPSELGVIAEKGAALAAAGLPTPRSIAWGRHTIEILADPLRIQVSTSGKLRQEIRFDPDSTNVHFNLSGAPVYGLGEGTRIYDLTGATERMANGQGADTTVYGARVPIPWVISPLGWGIFIGQPSGDFVFNNSEGQFRAVEATSTRNVFLALGDTPAEVLREYAALTGTPHLPPLWSLGYLQSHRTLTNEADLLDEAKTFRDKKLPCDAMIYLGTGFCPSGWNTGHGSFTFNDAVFPDPAATIAKLHGDDFKVVVHIVPPGDFHGRVADMGAAAAAPGDAAPYWKEHAGVMALGVDGFWPDEGDKLSVYARADRNRMYWDGMRKTAPAKRPFALHRNGYAGLQRYGWLWSGDVNADWKAFKAQVGVGIAVGLSGIAHWGTDTGGFVATPELSPELYVRWFQFSAFCPLFRSHGRAWKLRLPWGWNLGTPGPKETTEAFAANWPPEADLHRPDVEVICRKYLELRYRLLPYLYSELAETHVTGMPMIRALWLAHPDDVSARAATDCYHWGGAFLVAPVTEKDAVQKTHYLPPGVWWDYFTGERLDGGKMVTRQAALADLPLYVKAGAIVPTGPVKQHTGTLKDAEVMLTVYPGADGDFVWYEDDGESFAHDSGAFMRVRCAWNDVGRKLTLTRDPAGHWGVGRKLTVQLQGGAPKAVTLGAGATGVTL